MEWCVRLRLSLGGPVAYPGGREGTPYLCLTLSPSPPPSTLSLQVCAARDRATGQKVAIKKIHPMSKSSHAKYTLREVLLMRHLGKCENVIGMIDLYAREKADEIYLVMDYLDADLHRVIQSKQTLSVEHLRYFMWQIFRGIQFMHAHGVLHRDLKPSNLLVNRNCALKIGDFGLARVAPDAGTAGLMTQHVVTRWYRSPELMLCPDGKYTAAVDLWSVGCILGEVLGRRPMFPGKSSMQQLNLIFDVIGSPGSSELGCVKTEQARRCVCVCGGECFNVIMTGFYSFFTSNYFLISCHFFSFFRYVRSMGFKRRVDFKKKFPNAEPEAISLLSQLLVFVPAKRLTVEQAMAHPFFNKLRNALTPAQRAVSTSPSKSGFNFGDFEFETQKLSTPQIRKLIMEEVGYYAVKNAKVAAGKSEKRAAAADGASASSRSKSSSSSSSRSGVARPSTAASTAKGASASSASFRPSTAAPATSSTAAAAAAAAPARELSASEAAAASHAMAVATGAAERKVTSLSRKQSPAMAMAKAISVAHNAAVAALAAARISARSVTMVAVRNASTAADDAAFASAVAAAAAFDCTFIAHVVAVATLAARAARAAAHAAAAAALSAKVSIPTALSSKDVQRRHASPRGVEGLKANANSHTNAASILRAASLSTDAGLSSERGSLVSAISATSALSGERTWDAASENASSVEQRASAWNLSRPMSSAALARRVGDAASSSSASTSSARALLPSSSSSLSMSSSSTAAGALRPSTAQTLSARAKEHARAMSAAASTSSSTAVALATTTAATMVKTKTTTKAKVASSSSSNHRSQAEEEHWKSVAARRSNRTNARSHLRPSTSSSSSSSSSLIFSGKHGSSSSSRTAHHARPSTSSLYSRKSAESVAASHTSSSSSSHHSSSSTFRPSTASERSSSSSSSTLTRESSGHGQGQGHRRERALDHHRNHGNHHHSSSASRRLAEMEARDERERESTISRGSARSVIMQRRAEAEKARLRSVVRESERSDAYSSSGRSKQPKGTTVPVPFSFNSRRGKKSGKSTQPRWGAGGRISSSSTNSDRSSNVSSRSDRHRTHGHGHGHGRDRDSSSGSRLKHSSTSSHASNSIAQQHLFGGSGRSGVPSVASTVSSSGAKKVTVPSSPRFSRMSWQRQQQARKWGR